VLLLPIKTASNGLTLIEGSNSLSITLKARLLTCFIATHVILVEPLLNIRDELQAINRVHRIGQVWFVSFTTIQVFIILLGQRNARLSTIRSKYHRREHIRSSVEQAKQGRVNYHPPEESQSYFTLESVRDSFFVLCNAQ